jgi:hypothetical protein
VDRTDAEAVRDQLLELLDERHEAGPTAYVVNRATVEGLDAGDDPDAAAVVLVFRHAVDAAIVERRFDELVTEPGAGPVTAEAFAWHLYNSLEAGRL